MSERFIVEKGCRMAIRDTLEGKSRRIVALFFSDPGNKDAAESLARISAEALNAAWRRKLERPPLVEACKP